MKNKSNNQMRFIGSYSPYMKDESEDMEIWFERYKNDAYNTKCFNGISFSRIIYISRLCIREEQLLSIIFVPDTSIKIGDTLVDENGLEFTVRSIEMIRFAGMVPEWYFKALPIILSGKDENIGEYLRLKT